jgi:DNA-binding response OmpR family regulator
MTRILVVEDDAQTANEINAALGDYGFAVDCASTGREGLLKAAADPYDAIVLDRMLPGGLDGLAVLTALRAAGVDAPVLILSALSAVDERVRGLRAGGDDYMTKPFNSEELTARLEVLLRRRGAGHRDMSLTAADLELDLISRTAHRAGAEIRLMPTEYKLLEYLMRNSGQILTRTMIFEAIWGYHFDPGTNLIDVHLGRLRRKIDRPGLAPLIHTIRGSGYALHAPQ